MSILLQNTTHETVLVDSDPKMLSECLTYYNIAKSADDNIDQVARLYTTKVNCRRQLLQVFYNELDIAVINSVAVYRKIFAPKISCNVGVDVKYISLEDLFEENA